MKILLINFYYTLHKKKRTIAICLIFYELMFHYAVRFGDTSLPLTFIYHSIQSYNHGIREIGYRLFEFAQPSIPSKCTVSNSTFHF